MIISKKILIFLIFVILVLSSCSPDKSEGSRCSIDNDCPLAGKCEVAQCVDSYCQKQKITDCCGNGVCEDKIGEDVCSCKVDCAGSCEGPVEFTLPGGVKTQSKYFDYGCGEGNESERRCIIRYDLSEIDPREEYHEISKDNILAGLTVKYIQPFVIKQHNIGVEIQLKAFDDEKVMLPLRINEIRVMESALLLGRKRDIKKDLSKVGELYSTTIPLDYSMGLPEEQKSVSIEVDYQYKKLKKIQAKDSDGKVKYDNNGEPIYVYVDDGLFISKDAKTLKNRIYFLDPDYDEIKVDFSQD